MNDEPNPLENMTNKDVEEFCKKFDIPYIPQDDEDFKPKKKKKKELGQDDA